MLMRKILMTLAAGFLAAGAGAQSLKMANANYPGIYCRFSSNCQITPTETSDTFLPTNVAATCVLSSRSFPGNSADSLGKYGYEYQLTLNSAGAGMLDTNVLAVDSLTLEFGEPDNFAFGEHASNQVWAVVSGGPVGLVPSSAELSGKEVIIHFDPPLTLDPQVGSSTNTCYFGMISDSAPETTTAILKGSVNGTSAVKGKLQAQTP